jgi:2-polyprenyl-3-methyl-5-hydroxy-6-metoxy-1,4-benzoquinol methylase
MPDTRSYWEMRAKKFGKRAVINLSHPESQYEEVTANQKKMLLPILARHLDGSEKTVLDFGCGPGRFTADLAQLVRGNVIGFDVSSALIALAPKAAGVRYYASDATKTVLETRFDLIWICLVLGGIRDPQLSSVATHLQSALVPNGLLFLVENTSVKEDVPHWSYRSVASYQSLFHTIDLSLEATYDDLGEEISIMVGRKRDNSGKEHA